MPGSIQIVGLGPGDPLLRSVGADRALETAKRIILRTSVHPGLDRLDTSAVVSSCDDLYESSDTFEAVYRSIADRVIEAAKDRDVVYAVPGSPAFGEMTVRLIIELAESHGIPIMVVPSIDGVQVCAAALNIDLLLDEVQLLDGMSFVQVADRFPFTGAPFNIVVSRPSLIFQVYNNHVAERVQEVLSRLLPAEFPVTVIRAAGVRDKQELREIALKNLGRSRMDHLTTLWVPALGPVDEWRTPVRLHQLIATLRSPEGCPWDREQSYASLRPKLLEEAYETADAIDADDEIELAKELGDLLLLVALYVQIAEEAGSFTIEDVYEHVNRKLVRRHPHVFGDELASSPADVVTTWRRVKAAERESNGAVAESSAPIDKYPKSMPIIDRLMQMHDDHQIAVDDRHEPNEDVGDQLLSLVEAAIGKGLNPNQMIEEAYRRRNLNPA
jgi:tetrapyrrole methylase family protein / MazG family protein